jgi:hypothetical protein
MKAIKHVIAGATVVLLGVAPLQAQVPQGYQCSIKTSAFVTGDGKLSVNSFTKIFLGRKFVVDVGTGRMIGDVTNHNAFGDPVLINRGDEKNGFKAVTVYKPNPTIDVINVETFVAGSLKPFFFTSDTHVMTGLCAAI